MPRADHVVMDTATQAFVCKHCGRSYKPNLPAPIGVMVGMMQAFSRSHAKCPKPAEADLSKRFDPADVTVRM